MHVAQFQRGVVNLVELVGVGPVGPAPHAHRQRLLGVGLAGPLERELHQPRGDFVFFLLGEFDFEP